MAITPNSTILLFTGIPLDNKYRNVIDFESVGARTAYFASGGAVAVLSPDTYQRVNSKQFKAKISADSIYNVNYMAFQNTNHGSKWFYAFVLSIDYINDGACMVNYEIDVMTTYFLDCTVKRSFVERQHIASDAIGNSITPEPVALGEYQLDNYDVLYAPAVATSKIIVQICNNNASSVSTDMFDGIATGCEFYAYDISTIGNLADLLQTYIVNPNAVVNMYMVPGYLVSGSGSISGQTAQTLSVQVPAGSSYTTFGSYTPKNKKLFTYPYHYCHVDNANGQSLATRYEFFTNNTPQFRLYGTLNSPVQLKLSPEHYKGTSIPLHTESLTVDGFPLCSWNYDTYKAWIAQNSVPIETSLIAGIATAGLGIATGGLGAVAGISAGIGAVANLVNQNYKASKEADICRGSTSSGNVNFSNQINTFFVGRAHITADYAEVIDNFFSTYGYAVNKVTMPNLHSRPHWNYVKTCGLNIVGNCPGDAISKIIDIFDSGVTLWRNASEIGNYALDNSAS